MTVTTSTIVSATTSTTSTTSTSTNQSGFVPYYSPVGNYKCETGPFYFATSFYARTEARAKETCKRYDCDIIVEWTNRRRYVRTGWDIGNFDRDVPTCLHNRDMTAKMIWRKHNKYH